MKAISRCQQLPAGLLPGLPRFRINLYVENARNPVLAQGIADIVRDVYWRVLHDPTVEPGPRICA